MNDYVYYMKKALSLAEKAGKTGEVPVGAVIVNNETGEIVGEGFNRRECDMNPLAHAEISAIQQASQKLKRWRLTGCSIYVTLEPCPMCCGAIINSRIDHVYFGAYDKKAGSVVSLQQMFSMPYNHKPEFTGGILQDECSGILSDFFKNLRIINNYLGGIRMVKLENEWDELLKEEFEKDYYQNLRQFLLTEYKTQTIYPNMYNIFNALKYTSYNDVKVVIIGQDPYHGPNQAHGLSFSVQKGVKVPPSLVNIFKEIKDDIGTDNLGKHGELTKWAENGVLLLNAVLTVRGGQANSHKGKGWEQFTDSVIKLLNKRDKPVVFMLWGANAKAKAMYITNPNHLVLTSAHPSPLSAFNGFFGCKHFSKANEFLKNNNMTEIDWSI